MIRLPLSTIALMVVLMMSPTGWAMARPAGPLETVSQRPLTVAIQYDQTYIMKDKEGEWSGPMVDFWKLVAQELRQPYLFKEMSLNNIVIALEEGTIDVAAPRML